VRVATQYDGVQVSGKGLAQQRSLKYLQGLAQGCWLVSWAWLEGCAAAGCWLPEEPFELAGDHVALGAPKAGVETLFLALVQVDNSSADVYIFGVSPDRAVCVMSYELQMFTLQWQTGHEPMLLM